MKQTIMWLALGLLFALGVTLSVTADSYGPSATAQTTGSATLVQPPQPVLAATARPVVIDTPRPVVIETPRPVVAANAKPAEPEVPVAMLDDAPPRSSIRPDALSRWYVESGASQAPRTAEAPVAPLPLTPVAAAANATQLAQDAKAGIKPLQGDARPARKPRDSNAQLPGKRRTTNARACGSQGRFADLLRQLKIGSRCTTRRSAA
jgi:hypothetical protein